MTTFPVTIERNDSLFDAHRTERISTSSEDGGVGTYTLPPHTTKERTTTNLKTKNNQHCLKIELYGSPTTKELKRKHSSRLVGGAEMGSRVERTNNGRAKKVLPR